MQLFFLGQVLLGRFDQVGNLESFLPYGEDPFWVLL
jgi:hypothetical protein